ncbi:Asx homology domain-containing protein [Podospora appendiculata]|uniref:Asx homology domain-containing protein n=1 Tax=Podospora appendiculata TaxID=314037 RepID=A0AAE0X4H6_9PEZI|nr:Asx homology domain-containing protein [Podospora appendiculata]
MAAGSEISSPLSSPPKSEDGMGNSPPSPLETKPSIREKIQELKKTKEEKQKGALPLAGPHGSDTGDHARLPAKRKAPPPDDNSDSKDIPLAKARPRRSKAPASTPPDPAPVRIKLVPSRITAKERKKWEAPYVFTSTKSPLAHANLREILLLPEAWDILTPEEKADVLSKFPDDTHILNAGTPEACPNRESLRNDDNFRHDCARYRENIEQGRHDHEWLEQAWVAHQKHVRGDFDKHLQKKFEEDWGVKLSNEHPSKRPRLDENSSSRDSASKSSWSPDMFMDSYMRDMATSGSSIKNSSGPTSTPEAAQSSSEILASETSGSNGPEAVDPSLQAVAPDTSSPIESSFEEHISDILSTRCDSPGHSPPLSSPDNHDVSNDNESFSLKGGELDDHRTQQPLSSHEESDAVRPPDTKDENRDNHGENYRLHAHLPASSTPDELETTIPVELLRDSEKKDSCIPISNTVLELKTKPPSSPSCPGPLNPALNHARPNAGVFINSEENDIVAQV